VGYSRQLSKLITNMTYFSLLRNAFTVHLPIEIDNVTKCLNVILDIYSIILYSITYVGLDNIKIY